MGWCWIEPGRRGLEAGRTFSVAEVGTRPSALPCGMVAVLMLFLIPVGGGIPAGVLLARSRGFEWPLTAGLYLVSDLMLAVAFEPLLRLLVALGSRVGFLVRLGVVMQLAMARSAAHFAGTGAGPFGLLMIAFGVDPMTGRASAMAAGHGFVAGWSFAIAGDMLYYGVIAVTTLRLSTRIHNPDVIVGLMLAGMIIVPLLVRQARSAWGRRGERA